MAEFVQRRVEEQIPELEQLERVGLLTQVEVRSVIRKRTSLEYKLKRREAEKEDFIRYIQYEISFLELLKKRRQRIGFSYKKEEIEFIIMKRIHQLFSRATNKWKEDLQLWMSHVAFCKKWNCKTKLSKIFSSLLAIHPDKPALWISAAKWEFEDRISVENSRLLFLRSLRYHPESSKLYQEYFRMELMNAEKQRHEKIALSQSHVELGEVGFSAAILDGELARVVYKSAVQKIKGAEFHLSLLKIAQKFRFTEELQKEILSDLQALHAGDPLMWDFLARQELSASPSAESGENKAQRTARQEEESHRVYENALISHPQGISLLLDLGDGISALSVSSAAVGRFGTSLDVWRRRLDLVISMKAEFGEVEAEFEKALTQLKEKDTPPVWTMLVEWSEKERGGADTESLYQKLILNPNVCRIMKVKFLDWTYRSRGYHSARTTFTRLRENRPLSEEFFQKMIDIEKDRDQSKMADLRECYERALREFGSVNPDLWLSYIKEEMSHPEGKAENCAAIYWRAMRTLQGGDVEKFIHSYTMIQTGHRM
ncbi:LOW QUALITY PROTEIN: U3 small nucleolar RNA-associated protein 6 homolog [Mantella aurantiaca]